MVLETLLDYQQPGGDANIDLHSSADGTRACNCSSFVTNPGADSMLTVADLVLTIQFGNDHKLTRPVLQIFYTLQDGTGLTLVSLVATQTLTNKN